VLVFPIQIDDEVLTEMPLYERRERLKKIIKKVENENASKGDLVVLCPLELEDRECDDQSHPLREGELNDLKGKTKFKTADHAMLLLNESIDRAEEGIILKDPMVRRPPDLSLDLYMRADSTIVHSHSRALHGSVHSWSLSRI
jgi:ATP-dependent DNA ligase